MAKPQTSTRHKGHAENEEVHKQKTMQECMSGGLSLIWSLSDSWFSINQYFILAATKTLHPSSASL
jgi:hypothetical protein